MTQTLWQFTPLVIPLVLIAIANAWLAAETWRRRPFPAALPLASLLAAVSIWTFLNALEKSLTDFGSRYLISTIQYLFITAIPTSWFVFGARFSGRDYWLGRVALGLLMIEPIVVCVAAFLDPWHGLVRVRAEMVSEHGQAVLAIWYGPVFWFHAIYAYTLYLAGSFFIVVGVMSRPGWRDYRLVVMLASMAAPAAANIAYVLKIPPTSNVNLTALFLGVTAACAFWMLFHLRLFDIRPIARALVLEQMDDAILILDVHRRLLDANRAGQRLLSAPWLRLTGATIDDVLAPIARHVPTDLSRFPASTLIELDADGQRRVFDLSVIEPREGSRGVGIVLRLVDVTDRQRAIEERQRLEQALAQTQKIESLGVMAGGVAHDFNNLLAVIQGNVELAREELPENSPANLYLQRVLRAAESAASLTSQMLAFSGKSRHSTERISLRALVNEMRDFLSAAVAPPGVLEVDVGSDPVWTQADAPQLRQCLMNLVVNGSDALEGETGVVRIRCRVASVDSGDLERAAYRGELTPGPCALLEVSDTGSGIAEHLIPRIFDPFFSTKFAGRGLGLAVVMGVARAHQGGLIIESRVGAGTDARLLLPLAAPLPSPPDVVHEIAAKKAAPRPSMVLVIDDEPDVLRVAERLLERTGFRVHSATSGLEALAAFERMRDEIDVVLLDLTMPGLPGDVVFDKLRAIDPTIPILMTSGYDQAEALSRVQGDGPFAFLGKPFRGADLVEKLRSLIAERTRREARPLS